MVRPKRYSSNATLLALKSASLLPVNSNLFALSVDVLFSEDKRRSCGQQAVVATLAVTYSAPCSHAHTRRQRRRCLGRLSNNMLTGQIPEVLRFLADTLTELRMANNQFTGCVPPALNGVAINDLDDLGLPDCTE